MRRTDPQQAWFARLRETLEESLKHVTLSVHPSRANMRGSSSYTVYHYTITKPGLRWGVDRRYSECHRVRQQLLRCFRRANPTLAGFLAPIANVDFPKKRFSEDTKCIVSERKLKLKLFLRACLEVRATLIAYVTVYLTQQQHPAHQHDRMNRLEEIINQIDSFLDMPPQLRDDERRLANGMLALLKQHKSTMFQSSISRISCLEDCAICLCEFDPTDESDMVITLPCSHVFHGECLFPWLVRDHSCPLCRTSAVSC
ncbi:unnamed protein product [Aphanomyces euteiches]